MRNIFPSSLNFVEKMLNIIDTQSEDPTVMYQVMLNPSKLVSVKIWTTPILVNCWTKMRKKTVLFWMVSVSWPSAFAKAIKTKVERTLMI